MTQTVPTQTVPTQTGPTQTGPTGRPAQPADGDTRMTLMCYNDTHGYGWRHVDLFVHDAEGRELGWVHWQAPADGPEAADAVTARVEPLLRRTSEWRHAVSVSGMDYWTADAAWEQA